jgi:ferrous iron transport protein B
MMDRMRAQFSRAAAYAYMLFVLLYIPCVAAMAAAIREMGKGLGSVLVAYTLIVAWSISVLFYQLATAPTFGPVLLAVGLLALTAIGLWVLGRTVYRPSVIEGRESARTAR